MGIEIERKFLVSGEAWRTAAERVQPMAQGYLNDLGAVEHGAQKASVRVRIEGEHAFLNIKSREAGHTRQEFDYPLPVDDARQLLRLCVGGLVDKRRHYVRHEGQTQEVYLDADAPAQIYPGDVVRVPSSLFWDAISVLGPLSGFAALYGAYHN